MTPKAHAESIVKSEVFPKYVEIVLPLPIRQTFTYSIPFGLDKEIKIGARVVVPFGKRKLTGYAVELLETLPEDLGFEESSIRDIYELLDSEPLLTTELIKLTKWTSDYYATSWGEMLKASLPAGININAERYFSITETGRENLANGKSTRSAKSRLLKYLEDNGEADSKVIAKEFSPPKANRILRELLKEDSVNVVFRTVQKTTKVKRQKAVRLIPETPDDVLSKPHSPKQKKVLKLLESNGGELLFSELLELADVGASSITTLAKRGSVEIYVREIRRDPLGDVSLPKPQELTLTDEQVSVLSRITAAISVNKYKTFLLHGVTGSGKTEVYIRAMAKSLSEGRSAMMLVPEIALTPVFSKRLRVVFGDDVAILHSALSTGERFDEWHRLKTGKARIAIGTRSAVFAPLQNIGLIIVDEEHDSSYRQQETPFYHGRDVAIMRAHSANAVVVLGSATPALETFHNAQIGKYEYLSLPNRIENRPMAKAELIDMRKVFKDEGAVILSQQLIDAISETHSRGEQTIILLNRRGFSSFLLCRSCGETIRCPNCDISLTFHRRENTLVCHYCNHHAKIPTDCPACQKQFLHFVGEGTEQIEDILREKFADLKIARIDRDTTRRKNELEMTLSAFSRGEIDMLVGTQMLAKGHDFHNVTLVGVISVDIGLGLPDFRSAEKTFQLLTQVAGRAGRGSLQGKVLIQTFHPEHYALKHAENQSYEGFYEVEAKFRKRFNYPPFVVLASILVKHSDLHYAFTNAKIIRDCLRRMNKNGNCALMGPAPAPLSKLKGEHRFQILVKARNRSHLRKLLDSALAEAESEKCDLKIVFVEIDPVNLL